MHPRFSGFHRTSLIDCHVHHRDAAISRDVITVMDSTGVDAVNLVSTPHPEHFGVAPQALEFKALNPQRAYLFGNLDYHESLTHGRLNSHLAHQVTMLQEIGCDGIKMIEGKPAARKRMGLPRFDGPEYQAFFARMESLGFPLLFHVGDADRFWSDDLAPTGAGPGSRFHGRYDHSYPTKEELYAELSHVLESCPELKVIFAHFYFLSADLPRVAALMDAFPNVHVDLSPGSGMYVNFSGHPEVAREFFLAHHDRILYGTDTGTSALGREDGPKRMAEMDKYWYMRTFLEAEGEFRAPPTFRQGQVALTGIGLPEEALENIYHRNFRRLVGDSPAPIGVPAVYEECQRLAALLEGMGRSTGEIRRLAQTVARCSSHQRSPEAGR